MRGLTTWASPKNVKNLTKSKSVCRSLRGPVGWLGLPPEFSSPDHPGSDEISVWSWRFQSRIAAVAMGIQVN